MKRQGTDIEYKERLYGYLKELLGTYWYIMVLEYSSITIPVLVSRRTLVVPVTGCGSGVWSP